MRSFTLIELLFVIAIIAILGNMLVVFPTLLEPTNKLKSATESGISALLEARAKTLASQGNSSHGVHFESNVIVLFKGTSYSPTDPSNENTTLPSGIAISNVNIEGGGSEVKFKRLNGETDQFGTITFHVIANPTRTRSITILKSGLVRE